MLHIIWKKLLGCKCCEGCLTFDEMALSIAEKEGGKESQNIAEIREMLSVTLDLLADHLENHCDNCLLDFIKRRGKKN